MTCTFDLYLSDWVLGLLASALTFLLVQTVTPVVLDVERRFVA